MIDSPRCCFILFIGWKFDASMHTSVRCIGEINRWIKQRSLCGLLIEFQSGRIHVISAPKDAIVTQGSDISIDCTVDALAVGDSLAWWHQTPDRFTRLFLSHGIEPGDMNLVDTDKYEIRGHYNLVIKSAEFSDAGVYVCQITGHGNYTAEVSVLGKVLLYAALMFIREFNVSHATCLITYWHRSTFSVCFWTTATAIVYRYSMPSLQPNRYFSLYE